ncbi:MAG: hypothetical protein HFI92_06745 [Lachnospiraceae bacterium]|nr:hypothetical protein [Lachnospiraceae bacterium]
MSKAEALHELYHQCKSIEFDESYDLLKSASDKEEDFFRVVTDFILCQKQQAAIREKRF